MYLHTMLFVYFSLCSSFCIYIKFNKHHGKSAAYCEKTIVNQCWTMREKKYKIISKWHAKCPFAQKHILFVHFFGLRDHKNHRMKSYILFSEYRVDGSISCKTLVLFLLTQSRRKKSKASWLRRKVKFARGKHFHNIPCWIILK